VGDAGNIIADAIDTSCSETHVTMTGLSDSGAQRLQRTGPVLLQAINRRGRQSVRSLVESTWIGLGGPACVENASELDDAATYFDLLDSLENENLPVDRDTLELRLQDLYAEPDAEADGKLQVLTIHSAKGLQFDTVILPGLNRATSGDSAKLLHWFELPDQEKIVMSPMRNSAEKEQQKKSGDLIQFISGVEKQRQGLEGGRLLYVAATRAAHSLYLFAAIKPTANGDIRASSRSLLGGLWPAIEDEQIGLISTAADTLPALEEREGETETAGVNLPQVYRRLTADWQLPEIPGAVQALKAETAETQDYIEFNWAGEDARLTGNLVHRLFQLISEQGLEKWEAGGDISRHCNWCRQILSSEGVQKDKADAIISRVTRAIENCLASEKGRWILENHEDGHCEYAITAVLGQQRPISMKLDRTFIANGTRWIIDYKTNSHEGGDLEGFLENEVRRYQDQLQRYRDAMALTETLPIKMALYFPLQDSFKEVFEPGPTTTPEPG